MQNDIVHLNVGGQRFSTSKRTLLSVQGEETFFTSLLSGRISSNVDETGAYFIDRDPTLFRLILNYLRTHQLHLLGNILKLPKCRFWEYKNLLAQN